MWKIYNSELIKFLSSSSAIINNDRCTVIDYNQYRHTRVHYIAVWGNIKLNLIFQRLSKGYSQ